MLCLLNNKNLKLDMCIDCFKTGYPGALELEQFEYVQKVKLVILGEEALTHENENEDENENEGEDEDENEDDSKVPL
jgi:hypothetical protein